MVERGKTSESTGSGVYFANLWGFEDGLIFGLAIDVRP